MNSPRAGGRYTISGTAASIVGAKDLTTKLRLTTWLVNERRLGNDCPRITSDLIRTIGTLPALALDERLNRLLELLDNSADWVGQLVPFEITNSAVKFYGDQVTTVGAVALAHTEAANASEVEYLLRCLAAAELINWPLTGSQAQITYKGYLRLAELRSHHVNSRQAFVAMWFDPSMTAAYTDGIKLAVEDAGYVPVRIDAKDHVNKIDDEIIAEIRRSRFIVADFTQGTTGARGGVYYEAGFAHGLGVPVIFSCHEGSLGNVHFDTRQYSHIVWKDPADLRVQLSRRISAVIGDGPLKAA